MIASELGVVGLMNIQYAIKDGELFILEVNPRASRTVPFVSKAIGVPIAKLATKVMLGHSLTELGFTKKINPTHVSVKESVFPFKRFPNINIALGPEMKSTGEVMGIDTSFELAFAKSQIAAGAELPTSGAVFISVHDFYKERIVPVARSFADLGFHHHVHHRYSGISEQPWGGGADRSQGERGQAQCDGLYQKRTDPAHYQCFNRKEAHGRRP